MPVLSCGNGAETGQVSMVIITTAGCATHFGRGTGGARQSGHPPDKVCWWQLAGLKLFIVLNKCMRSAINLLLFLGAGGGGV